MKRALVVVAALAALPLAACESASSAGGGERVSDVISLGQQYESPVGTIFVIDVQNEYRLLRAVASGAIARGYEDLFVIPQDDVKFNRWMPVAKAPGLELAIVSPTEVAFRYREAGGDGK